ncbi:MarR family transcriptional regulator [Haloferax marisrubri]|uniref:MarR family transcriptional regulator n=1 Tax=Haloferax marisrubri TaxID=1544719 RepID=A0A2P4NKY9_9EURY|nr:MarR family transcriptional regulator [Haloferax marisrubri]
MRPRIDWMTRADDAILELLSEAGIAANPSTIAFNIDYNNRYISQRCRILSENGLVERVHDTKAMYRITELGERYLAGDLSKVDLE